MIKGFVLTQASASDATLAAFHLLVIVCLRNYRDINLFLLIVAHLICLTVRPTPSR